MQLLYYLVYVYLVPNVYSYSGKQLHFNNVIILYFFTYFLETYVSTLSADLEGGGGDFVFLRSVDIPRWWIPILLELTMAGKFECSLRVENPPYPRSTDHAESVFVDLLRSPGMDSQPGRPVRQPYLKYQPARLHRLAESIPCNRFLCS